VCRPYTDFKSATTYLYVAVEALTEDAARLLTAETGFVFHRKPHAEIWSVRYVLYLTRARRFLPGEKAALAAMVNSQVSAKIRVSFNPDFGNSHFGTVTVTSPDRVRYSSKFLMLINFEKLEYINYVNK